MKTYYWKMTKPGNLIRNTNLKMKLRKALVFNLIRI